MGPGGDPNAAALTQPGPVGKHVSSASTAPSPQGRKREGLNEALSSYLAAA